MNKLKHKKKAILLSVVFLFLIGLTFSYFNWNNNHKNRISSKVFIGNIDLSNLQISEAEKIINQKAAEIEDSGLTVFYNNQEINLPIIMTVNTDLSFPIFNYETEETIKLIEDKYYGKSYFSYITNLFKNGLSKEQVKASYIIDPERVKQYIRENLKEVEVEPKNATFKINTNNKSGDLFDIEPERIGRIIDFDLALETIEQNLSDLDNQSKINLKTITARPTVYTTDLENLKTEAADLISKGDLKLHASSSTSTVWTVKKEVVASWIISNSNQDKLKLTLDQEKIKTYLSEKVAPSIEKEAALPRYEIKNGKMSSWQTGADGLKINLEQSAANIKDSYLNNKISEAELVVEIIKSEEAENTDKFNIKEIIGTGHSNFSGSPKNRVHNIKVGAEAVNGMLIAPGEEFSLVKTLGEIDAASGYLPELVIKNNKTIPEYGGGLCQVATTIFRSALESGLPITARQNHSYRVSYYEPAGTDAAVYDPWPDMRFLNDTGNYVLIQSRVEKNDIYFDFWGKKDGRTASSSKPVIYNIVKPAATKIIETTELKPGEKKCTEKAHNGADAYFDYQVVYSNGDIKDRRFKSRYVPWQEVCLVGVSSSTPINISSSSPAISSSTSN
jgi:vancomycin resistance protein YoaR